MAQFGRPVEDAWNGGWIRQNGDGIDVWQSIDDAVQDDTDYVQSGLNPAAQVLVVKLSPLVDPGVNTGHRFRIAGRKNISGGRIIDVLVQLRQDYVNEFTQGSLIAEANFLDVQEAAGAFGLYDSGELPQSIIGLITNYSTLSVRIVATVRP